MPPYWQQTNVCQKLLPRFTNYGTEKKKSSVLKVTLCSLLVNNDFLADIAILYSCYIIMYSQKYAPVVEKAEQVSFKTNI